MRRSRNRSTWTRETSALAHAAKARKRMENPVDRIERPKPGLLLHTIRVTNELEGHSFEIKVRQGKRLNGIQAETFGRSSNEHGNDWLCRHLRKKLVMRWMQE